MYGNALERVKRKRTSSGATTSRRVRADTKRGPQRRSRGSSGYARAANALVPARLKYVDKPYFNSPVAQSAVYAPTVLANPIDGPLNGIAVGDEPFERDNRAVRLKSCFVTGCIIYGPYQSTQEFELPTPIIYVALVLNKQTNGTDPIPSAVFQNPTSESQISGCPLRNLQYSHQYQVLDYVQIAVDPFSYNTAGTDNLVELQGKKYPFKLSWKGDLLVNFSGNDESMGSIVDNSISVFAWTTDPNVVTMGYNSRCRFVG